MARSPEYRVYIGAKGRCTNLKNSHYSYYGGRGIEFKFKSFLEFFSEVGLRPEGLTLERIDNNGHYEKGNVKWASRGDQVRNRRNFFRAKRSGRGYYFIRGKWVARICFKGKMVYWKSCNSEEEAKAAYELKLNELLIQEKEKTHGS